MVVWHTPNILYSNRPTTDALRILYSDAHILYSTDLGWMELIQTEDVQPNRDEEGIRKFAEQGLHHLGPGHPSNQSRGKPIPLFSFNMHDDEKRTETLQRARAQGSRYIRKKASRHRARRGMPSQRARAQPCATSTTPRISPL